MSGVCDEILKSAIDALRLNQWTLLYKVPRTEAVEVQLQANLAAIGTLLDELHGRKVPSGVGSAGGDTE